MCATAHARVHAYARTCTCSGKCACLVCLVPTLKRTCTRLQTAAHCVHVLPCKWLHSNKPTHTTPSFRFTSMHCPDTQLQNCSPSSHMATTARSTGRPLMISPLKSHVPPGGRFLTQVDTHASISLCAGRGSPAASLMRRVGSSLAMHSSRLRLGMMAGSWCTGSDGDGGPQGKCHTCRTTNRGSGGC